MDNLDGRKEQFSPFLLSRNPKKATLKNVDFFPNEVTHFSIVYYAQHTLLLDTSQKNRKKLKEIVMDNFNLIFRITKRYYLKHWVQLSWILLMILTSSALTLGIPYLTRFFYDRVIVGQSTILLVQITLGILLASVLVFGLKSYSGYLMNLIEIDVQKDIRLDLTRKVNQMNILEYYKKTPEYLYNRILTDSAMIQESTVSTMMDVFRDSLIVVTGIIMMLSINVYLTAMVVAMQALSSIWSIQMGKLLATYQQKLIEELTIYNSVMQEAISSTLLSKLYKMVSFFTTRIANYYKHFIAIFKQARIKALKNSYLIYSISAISNFLILLVGGRLIMVGTISIGDLIAYIAVFNIVSSPAGSIIINLMNFRKNIPIFERVEDFLLMDSDSASDNQKCDFVQSIDLKNCSYSFNGSDTVLSGINYSFQPGKIYVLSGASGIGKTTLLYLLLGIYPLDEGDILFDSTVLEWGNVSAFRDRISFVEQEPTIINDTLFNNILIGNPTANEEQVLSAARAAYVDEFAQKMPSQYNTQLGANGQQLSTGQKQRMAIARALLKDPRLYLFDEPTSNIDRESINYICNTIKQINKDRFVIVVSHSSDFNDLADVTLLLKDGNLIEI